MASPQYISGPTNPRVVTVADAKATVKGNLVAMSSGTLVNSSDTTWDTNLATTQTAFGAIFLGVSAQTKTTSQTRPYGNGTANQITVHTSGIFEYDCASATFEVGDLVGPAKQSGNALEDQKVVAVASEAYATGRVAKRGTSITRVQVDILSNIQPRAQQS